MKHHIYFLSVFGFLLGFAVHVFVQVNDIAQSKKLSIKSILILKASTVLSRGLICTSIFMLWLEGQIADVIAGLNIHLPDKLTGVIDLHVSAPIALIAGYTFDSLLAYIPFFKSSLPPPIDAPATDTTAPVNKPS